MQDAIASQQAVPGAQEDDEHSGPHLPADGFLDPEPGIPDDGGYASEGDQGWEAYHDGPEWDAAAPADMQVRILMAKASHLLCCLCLRSAPRHRLKLAVAVTGRAECRAELRGCLPSARGEPSGQRSSGGAHHSPVHACRLLAKQGAALTSTILLLGC